VPDVPSIPRRPGLPIALDWAALRDEGLEHIRQLSGLIWTDHNLHDPGVTILELLCYALTDLAYRTGFDIQDLMTGPEGVIDPPSVSGLVPAHEALTTGPRTIADYRRLLLRIEGVRNAWLDPMTDPGDAANYRLSEVPIYADCGADALTFQPFAADSGANHPVRLSGLYKVLVELDIDDELGSLNEVGITYRVRKGALRGATVRFDCRDPRLLDGSLQPSADLVSVDKATVSTDGPGFAATVEISVKGGAKIELTNCTLRLRADRTRPGRPELNINSNALNAMLVSNEPDGLVPQFWRKLQRRRRSLAAIECALHAHRGLCEDFFSIHTITPYRIGICADVEVGADADMERVQAELFHAIENYLSPPVRYRTLAEMLDSGRQPDQIFNGPFVDFDFTCQGQPVFTKAGFITDETLAATEIRRSVRASDIINLAVDIEGIEAIRDIQLRAYDATGLAIGTTDKWTLPVPPGRQPVFFADGSKLLFHRAGIPYRAQPGEFAATLGYLRALARREVYVPPDQTLAAPTGRWRMLDSFHSVAHDLPETYRVGRAGVAVSEGEERVARARQLKGYLAFFDQLLADYLGQLTNARRLLSLDRAMTRSWFTQLVPDAAGSLTADFATEFHFDPDPLKDELTRTRLTESQEEFLDRRGRALDHLIARFAERFADYAAMMFRRSGDRTEVSEELIQDKISFLADYPRLSRGRGQAANIQPENAAAVWDSDNVSGLERRAGRLLGIDRCDRRNLQADAHLGRLFSFVGGAGNVRLKIAGGDGSTLFESEETFADKDAARQIASQAYRKLRDEGMLDVEETQGAGTFKLKILSGSAPITHRHGFDTDQDAVMAARAVLDRYDELLADIGEEGEGMHLIEHIHLRPRSDADRLMQVCLPDECDFCGDEDPYSFRVSVVLPYWPGRFRDLNFRAVVERTLREEAPAHVQVKICWISQGQMIELDEAYREWLAARAANSAGSAALRASSARLIAIIDALKSVYPQATLHDCDAGDNETIVRLGSTALGIF
jgi:hypothetical protein